jgi:hypothetical protein
MLPNRSCASPCPAPFCAGVASSFWPECEKAAAIIRPIDTPNRSEILIHADRFVVCKGICVFGYKAIFPTDGNQFTWRWQWNRPTRANSSASLFKRFAVMNLADPKSCVLCIEICSIENYLWDSLRDALPGW